MTCPLSSTTARCNIGTSRQLTGPLPSRTTSTASTTSGRSCAVATAGYLEYLSSLDDFSAGIRALDRLTQPRPINGRNVRGLNFFNRGEQTLLAALQRPAFNIAGLRRADLLPLLGQCSPATLTRQLPRPAPTARHQTRRRHLPLLSHPYWTSRDRRRPPPYRTDHHPSSRLTNLLTSCKHLARKLLREPGRRIRVGDCADGRDRIDNRASTTSSSICRCAA
jgi:hypothetical protein